MAEPQAQQPAERTAWDWWAILVAALGIYAVLLIVLNRRTVSVRFVFFTEKTRVVWLVLLSMALGALILWLVRHLRRRQPNRRARTEPAERAGVSWKVILIAALAVYAVLLIVFNSKTVKLNFVFVTEQTRVIWLVLLSVALGALIAWLVPRMRRRRAAD